MNITSEGRLGSNWIDEISDVLKRNRKIIITNLSITFFAFVVLTFSFGAFFSKLWMGSLIGFFLFICILVYMVLFARKPSPFDFSEILSYYLFGLFIRIDKFDGKKDYIADEAIKITKRIIDLISEFLDSEKEGSYLFFEFDKKSATLEKLQIELKKSFSYFKFYESNKHHQKEYANAVLKVSSMLHQNKNITDADLSVFETLPIKKIELVNEGWKKLRELFDRQIKRYFRIIFFSLLVIFIMWYLIPYFFRNILEKSAQLAITITIIGTAIASEFFGKSK